MKRACCRIRIRVHEAAAWMIADAPAAGRAIGKPVAARAACFRDFAARSRDEPCRSTWDVGVVVADTAGRVSAIHRGSTGVTARLPIARSVASGTISRSRNKRVFFWWTRSPAASPRVAFVLPSFVSVLTGHVLTPGTVAEGPQRCSRSRPLSVSASSGAKLARRRRTLVGQQYFSGYSVSFEHEYLQCEGEGATRELGSIIHVLQQRTDPRLPQKVLNHLRRGRVLRDGDLHHRLARPVAPLVQFSVPKSENFFI